MCTEKTIQWQIYSTDRVLFSVKQYMEHIGPTEKLIPDADPVSNVLVGENNGVDQGHNGGLIRGQLGLPDLVHK